MEELEQYDIGADLGGFEISWESVFSWLGISGISFLTAWGLFELIAAAIQYIKGI